MAYWCGSSKHPVSAIKEELVIVLLGSNADVKASCGNTIFERNVFSKTPSSLNVFERHDGIVLNRRVVVINTPDLHAKFGILSPEEQSIRTFLHSAFPGLHALLLVLKPGSLTGLKRDGLQHIDLIFGAGASEYVIVVSMHEEEMKDESVKDSDSRSVESLFRRRPHHHLQRDGDQSQVLKLLESIEKMVEKNGGRHLKIKKKVSQRSYSLSLDFIMLYDRRSRVIDPKNKRKSQDFEHPNLCDLRFVLLGKNDSENHRVRNVILPINENPTSLESQNLWKISGRVKDRHVIIIDALYLMKPNTSDDQITQTVRQCVYLSHPGPHVFIIALQYRDFTEEDMRRVKYVLNTFSEEAMRRTIIITTDEEAEMKHKSIHQLIKECEERHLQLHERKPEWPSEMLKMVDVILMKVLGDKENYLMCDAFHDVKETIVEEEEEQSTSDKSTRSEAENKTFSHHKDDGKAGESQKRKSGEERKQTQKWIQPTIKNDLNLVLCGSDSTLIVYVSKLLREKKIKPSHHRTVNEVCVKKEKIDGRLLSLVELPVLSRLSEEEVMRQALRCLTFCDPAGVHAFIIIVRAGPLTDEDKAEIEKIQKIFHSREHFLVLFITDLPDGTPDSIKRSSESQSLISRCGGHYRLMGLKESENSRQIPDLLDYIENMKTEPYSPQMFVKAKENRATQKLVEQHKKEMSEMENKIKELAEKIQSDDAECEAELERLRIVLIGRTGSGKSAVGNTVLGRTEFVSQISTDSVTTVCEKRVAEVDGRSIAVVDIGLFDTKLKNDEMVVEIMKCISLSSPGPHVFLIVLSLGRFTKEETDTLDLIKKIFGPKAAQFSIVLFTRGDDLKGESIEDYLRRSNNAELEKLIRDCGNRFLAFNNNENNDRTQVIQLLKMIEEVKNINQGRYFTNSMFEETKMSIKQRMEEIMKEKEREIKAQNETVKAKYDRVMKDMTKRFEDEKQRALDERMKIEEHFNEKVEKLKKEFEEKEQIEQKKRETEYKKQLEEEKQRKAEYNQKIEELSRAIENYRLEYEKQKKEREEEYQKREEKYKEDQDKLKRAQECIKKDLIKKEEEEIKKRDLEKKKRNEEEEEERQKWKSRLKEAENERKEIQEKIKRQQKEWEDEMKRQMKEREEEERKRKEKHEEDLREKQEELEKMRKRFEREREEERQKIEEERQRQRRKLEEKEREYEEKKLEMKRHYEHLEREEKEKWERRKREDEEIREEERKKSKTIIEDLKKEQREEMERIETERRRKEEKERNEMKQKYEEEIKEMKKEHDKARNLLSEQYEKLQEKGEEIKKLQKQVDDLKNKTVCAIM